MYFVCTKRKGCKCDFNIDAGWKIYLTLFILVAMGGFLVYLVAGIQSEIKSGGCDIDLGSLPGVLWGISIAQIVLPLIYTGIVLYTGKSGSSRSKDDDDDDDDDEGDEYYEDKNESENRERLAHKSIELEKDISSLDKQLTKYTSELNALKRKKVKKKDLDTRRTEIKIVSSKISDLEKRLKEAKSEHSSVESQLISGGSSRSSSSASSSGGGLGRGLGRGIGRGLGGGLEDDSVSGSV